MITLTITRTDGSVYWVERFNTQSECDKWLTEEKTRPYWVKSFAATSVLTPDRVTNPAESMQREKSNAALLKIKEFDKGKIKTISDVADAIETILIIQGLM